MKYLIPLVIATLLSACGKKEVTYIERPKPTAEQVRQQTPAAINRAIQLLALAYDKLPDQIFDVSKKDVASFLGTNKGNFRGTIELSLDYEYDPDCKAGTMAYVTHAESSPDKYVSTMHFCDYFYNNPINEQAQTVLHEMAHVVYGTGECRAMLFEFWVSYEVLGSYTPNDYYWNLNQCNGRGYGFYLPGQKGGIVATIDDHDGSPLTPTKQTSPLMAPPQ